MNANRITAVASFAWVVQIWKPSERIWVSFTEPIPYERAARVAKKLAEIPGRRVRLQRKEI